jgi:hypothetical protein
MGNHQPIHGSSDEAGNAGKGHTAFFHRGHWNHVDKIYKKRELDLKEQENEIRRRELERKERGLSNEAVDKVVDQFIRALGADPSDLWEGIENERPLEETAEETE